MIELFRVTRGTSDSSVVFFLIKIKKLMVELPNFLQDEEKD